MLTERIFNVMSAVFDVDRSTLDKSATPGSVEQWDSMRHMNLILALEEEFSIRFPEEQIDQLISFELIELTLRELSAK